MAGYCTRSHRCEHICVDVDWRNHVTACECRYGYTLHSDNETCIITPVPMPYLAANNSYVELPGLLNANHLRTDIEIFMRPTSLDGTILFTGYSVLGHAADFISLAVEGGHVVFRYDLGSGPAEIRSPYSIVINMWTLIKASRNGSMGRLEVNVDNVATGESQGTFNGLNVRGFLYLGRHPNHCLMPRSASAPLTLTGCVQRVVINNQTMALSGPNVFKFNVDNCSPCCEDGPCLNGGRCKATWGGYTCYCPLGFTNVHCEEVQDEVPAIPEFTGHSYVMYANDDLTNGMHSNDMAIALEVKPVTGSGLLFWSSHGTFAAPTEHDKDFMALGLSNGVLQFRYQLGSGEALISLYQPTLFDGNFHVIRAERSEREGTLSVDGAVATGTSPGNSRGFNSNGKVYLGGLPDVQEVTHNRFQSSFEGCIRSFSYSVGQSNTTVDILNQSYVAFNIRSCS
ncbi:pikachurin-like [Plakobranchus ocellatus]|uniref:Pikachurin-like n=1 Tax=Plakobranchus ocellatus TaxID=259542 RepID=A0AAV3Z4L2_9GAST|nr:pikachurin-like [Plakobranchus ocellatus]